MRPPGSAAVGRDNVACILDHRARFWVASIGGNLHPDVSALLAAAYAAGWRAATEGQPSTANPGTRLGSCYEGARHGAWGLGYARAKRWPAAEMIDRNTRSFVLEKLSAQAMGDPGPEAA